MLCFRIRMVFIHAFMVFAWLGIAGGVAAQNALDSYENDNTAESATPFVTLTPFGQQQHNFVQADDVDWVKFPAIAGVRYVIAVHPTGASADPGIELLAPDGTTVLVSEAEPWTDQSTFQCDAGGVEYYFKSVTYPNGQAVVDTTGADLCYRVPGANSNVFEVLTSNGPLGDDKAFLWEAPATGIYYVRVSQLNGIYGANTDYDLFVYRPFQQVATISGLITSDLAAALNGAVITSLLDGNGDGSTFSVSGGAYSLNVFNVFDHSVMYTLTIQLNGYLPLTIVLDTGCLFGSESGSDAICIGDQGTTPESPNFSFLSGFDLTLATDTDIDDDGVTNVEDNCPSIANAGQENHDQDSQGDACDDDDDNDGVADVNDAFPFDQSESVDTDGDGVGDQGDNCPLVANAGQENHDPDGLGDACDDDDDNDGVADANDAFPLDPAESADTDSDGVGDQADNCPSIANAGQQNNDQDNQGDVCDDDDDNDGMPDSFEITYAFDPFNPTDATLDSDGDGQTNLAEFQAGSNPRVNPNGGEQPDSAVAPLLPIILQVLD